MIENIKFLQHPTFVVLVTVLDVVRGGVGGALKKDLRPRSPFHHHRRAGHLPAAEEPLGVPGTLRVVVGVHNPTLPSLTRGDQ